MSFISRYGRRASDSDSDSDDASFGRSYYGQNSGFGFLPSTNSPYSNSYGSHFGAGDSDSDSGFGARGRRKTTRKRKKPKATSDSESDSDDTDEYSSFGKKKKRKSGMSTKRRKMLKEVMRLHHKQGKSLKQAWKIVKKKKKYQ